MYLTRTFINPRRRGATAFLDAPQKVHAAVLQSFPTDPPTKGSDGPRVLWRLDRDDPRRPVLWIVSPDRPDLHHVVDPYGWPAADSPFESREYKTLLDELADGQRWAFRVTLNPARARFDETRGRSVITPVVDPAEQVGWLVERTPKWGFAVPRTEGAGPAVEIRDGRRLRFRRGRGQPPVTLHTAMFQGLLEVTDAERLRQAMTSGVGRARGYGCGLLSLTRVR
ncbi:type I-E CRISPR-associated protein Cas6/Cse3/CasE [Marinitenerispora sediminis]|uniref:Type I-E CRISPR-associated protein Cas6/Cse3/CasE n=1 Tax=Marinitenerispora sediminis TaxID=1931232 RepID=A0A368SXT3_9ACTN|nr:type I-E CRISPR-associated protein Cas6/Cse3/CasE [Marinitenerispora sediminis]RCV47897.1 type I-E CRISPR-associated protein Cas6/Cse3/CasE [Marinitenerispora sediminis]